MPTLFRSSEHVIWRVVFCVQRWKVTLKHVRWKTTAKNSIGNKLECAQLGFDDDTYSTHDLSGADTQHAQHWQVISGQLGHPGGEGGNEKMRDEMSWWPMNEPPGLWLKNMDPGPRVPLTERLAGQTLTLSPGRHQPHWCCCCGPPRPGGLRWGRRRRYAPTRRSLFAPASPLRKASWTPRLWVRAFPQCPWCKLRKSCQSTATLLHVSAACASTYRHLL